MYSDYLVFPGKYTFYMCTIHAHYIECTLNTQDTICWRDEDARLLAVCSVSNHSTSGHLSSRQCLLILAQYLHTVYLQNTQIYTHTHDINTQHKYRIFTHNIDLYKKIFAHNINAQYNINGIFRHNILGRVLKPQDYYVFIHSYSYKNIILHTIFTQNIFFLRTINILCFY